MAFSKCGKCDRTLFEVVEKEPYGSNLKVMFVQCQSCGTPIGTMDYFAVGRIVNGLEKRIDKMEKLVKQIDYNVRLIAEAVQRGR